MSVLSISHILKALKSPIQTVEADIPVYGGCIDSRRCEDGSLFIAIKGEVTDGHFYVDNAFNNGAYMAIIDHAIESDYPVVDIADPNAIIPTEAPYSLLVPDSILALQTIATYWREQFDIPPVVGITGSVGKSSSKDLIASVLSHRMRTLKNPGNYNNEIGLPLTLLSLTHEHKIAVLEMGFYVAGEIKLLCDIAHPNIGVLTNIGTVHAERAGSIEAIAEGKAELLEELPEAPPKGLAILNYDDDFVREMASKTHARVFYYGLDPRADLWADEIESRGLNGIRCRLHHQGESYYLTAPLIGRHSVFTILRACAVALNLGISWDWIFHAFKSSREQVRVVTVKTPLPARSSSTIPTMPHPIQPLPLSTCLAISTDARLPYWAICLNSASTNAKDTAALACARQKSLMKSFWLAHAVKSRAMLSWRLNLNLKTCVGSKTPMKPSPT